MSDPLAAFREAYQEWERAILQPTLRRAPERDADFTTVSGEPIKRLYTPLDLE